MTAAQVLRFLPILLSAQWAYSTPASQVAQSKWQCLNETVGGRLYHAVPFSRPCFKSANTTVGAFSQSDCAAVQTGYADPGVRSSVFGAYTNTEWESCQATSEQCALSWQNPANSAAFDPPATCSQGSVSPYYIDVRSAADVQAALTFSKTNGVRLVIKNTGHDYKGRSSGKETLGLWVHNLKSITYNKSYRPQGCSSKKFSATPAVTHAAGVQFQELYEFAEQHNITLPGGSEITVGATGGYTQGGGHSPTSNIFGLGVDRVLEFEVVTPTGSHIFANDCQNSDLFFALRGGGGGTFGVVLSATTRALPQHSFTTVSAQLSGTVLPQFLPFVVNNSIQWSDDGWSGIIVLTPASVAMFLTSTTFTAAQAATKMASFQAIVAQLNGTSAINVLPSYLSFHNTYIGTNASPVGIPEILGSRLVPASAVKSHPAELVDAILKINAASVGTYLFATTPRTFKPFPGSTPPSVTPAWRDAIWHISAGTGWDFNTPLADKKALYGLITELMAPLRALTPTGGAYVNEADVHEPDYTTSFWGSNYAKLVQIKRKYDPNHLLDCWQCVDWKGANDAAFSCYV